MKNYEIGNKTKYNFKRKEREKKEKPGYIIPPFNQGLFSHFGV